MSYNSIISSDSFFSIQKATEENGKWNIVMKASTESVDREGDVVMQKALLDQKEFFSECGFISWNHQHKQGGPKYIIGEPDKVYSEGGATFVKGHLYQSNLIAKDIWDNIKSGAKIGCSIGGRVKSAESGNMFSKGSKAKRLTINKVMWDEIALTPTPVNLDTFGSVQMSKSLLLKSFVDGYPEEDEERKDRMEVSKELADLHNIRDPKNQVIVRLIVNLMTNNPRSMFSYFLNGLSNEDSFESIANDYFGLYSKDRKLRKTEVETFQNCFDYVLKNCISRKADTDERGGTDDGY